MRSQSRASYTFAHTFRRDAAVKNRDDCEREKFAFVFIIKRSHLFFFLLYIAFLASVCARTDVFNAHYVIVPATGDYTGNIGNYYPRNELFQYSRPRDFPSATRKRAERFYSRIDLVLFSRFLCARINKKCAISIFDSLGADLRARAKFRVREARTKIKRGTLLGGRKGQSDETGDEEGAVGSLRGGKGGQSHGGSALVFYDDAARAMRRGFLR